MKTLLYFRRFFRYRDNTPTRKIAIEISQEFTIFDLGITFFWETDNIFNQRTYILEMCFIFWDVCIKYSKTLKNKVV